MQKLCIRKCQCLEVQFQVLEIFLSIFKNTDHGGHKTLIKALVLKVPQEA